MALDAWLPVGFAIADGEHAKLAVYEGLDWQIYESRRGGWILVTKQGLAQKWLSSHLLGASSLQQFFFGDHAFSALTGGGSHVMAPVQAYHSPNSKNEAIAFAQSLKATRSIDGESSMHDAIYVERLSRLLPTYSLTPKVSDDFVLGTWLTGGVPVSVTSFRRLRSLVGWMGADHLAEVVKTAGFDVRERAVGPAQTESGVSPDAGSQSGFRLPGRPELEQFFNEHVIDIIENEERYKALGIDFPSAIIMHGPPGCGKTFGVERLVEYLGWPSFEIEASSVASPYIHETSKKVAEVFDKAMQNAPSVLIIDEMEAFLADRQMGAGSSHHRVEEVAEFLRRIPEAVKNHVLIFAMTNRIEMIDPAILRRGRFDHVLKVDMASEEEVRALLEKLVSDLPRSEDLDVASLAERLTGRPLSDVAFVVREGARLAARSGNDRIDHASLVRALESTPARTGVEDQPKRSIGFTWDKK